MFTVSVLHTQKFHVFQRIDTFELLMIVTSFVAILADFGLHSSSDLMNETQITLEQCQYNDLRHRGSEKMQNIYYDNIN